MLVAMPFFSRVLLGCVFFATVGCERTESSRHDGGLPPLGIPMTSGQDAAVAPGVTPTPDDAGPSAPARDPSISVIGVEGLDPSAPTRRNDTFETAALIEPGIGAHQDVVRFQQSNFFYFDASEAGFFELSTLDRQFSPDVVISLYDAERRLIAENDNGSLWPRDNFDARLVVRAARPGRYYVKVSDLTTSPSFFRNSASSLLYYHLDVRPVNGTTAGFGAAAASGETSVQFSVDEATGYSFITLLGTLEPSTMRSFAFEGLAAHALIGHLLPAGVPGDGSTAAPGRVRVLNMAQRVLGELDGRRAETQLYPPVSAGRTVVTVEAPDSVGDNGFFAIDLVMLPENPAEQTESVNGQLASAEPIALKGVPTQRGLLISDVPPGDVDYYSFSAPEAAHVAVSCEGQSAGSGVRALRAELRDSNDQVLATCIESPTHELNLDSWPLAAAGTYFLRLTSDPAQPPETAEPWVRCVVFVR